MSELLRAMAGLPRRMRLVLHQPETARYQRARARFDYLMEAAHVLGVRASGSSGSSLEVALWAPPPAGQGYGLYACVRLYYDGHALNLAVLFCFYDGTEGSPGFKSPAAALCFARSNGFEEPTDA